MKLSIITINKNNAAGLEKTCLSVVTQTSKDFEWIVIDGASDDTSVEIIRKYEQHISYWVSEPDAGIYNAMNKGIKISKGEYLLFLNSGDFLLHPWTIQDVFNEITNSSIADVYYSDAVADYIYNEYPDKITLKFLIFNMINHQNCLFRKELFTHQLFNENFKIYADRYFLISELLNNDITFYHIKNKISLYDNTGISADSSYKNIMKAEKAIILNEFNLKNFSYYTYQFMKKTFKYCKYLLPLGIYNLIKKNKSLVKIR